MTRSHSEDSPVTRRAIAEQLREMAMCIETGIVRPMWLAPISEGLRPLSKIVAAQCRARVQTASEHGEEAALREVIEARKVTDDGLPVGVYGTD